MSDPSVYDYVRYLDDEGSRQAIRRKGRKWHHLVIIDHPMRVVKVGPDDQEWIYSNADVPLASAVASFLATSERCGITEAARQLLTEAGQ